MSHPPVQSHEPVPSLYPIDRTFAMIKPDAIQHTDQIKYLIEKSGLTILQVRSRYFQTVEA
jgi:nucleoside diphosphate kinase